MAKKKKYDFGIDEVEEPKSNMGAPSKLTPEMYLKVTGLCLLGLTNLELAERFDVDEDTIYEWMKTDKDFSEAMDRGREGADIPVVNAVRKRALGYSYNEITYEKIVTSDLEDGEDEPMLVEAWKKKVTVKQVAPDVGAAKMWLSNRHPKRWRDSSNLDISSMGKPISQSLDVTKLSTAALMEIITATQNNDDTKS